MKNLYTRTWIGFIFLAVIMGFLLFFPAGTVKFWQGWVYLVIFFGIAASITIYLVKKDPALLARRVGAGPAAEKEPVQKIIMSFTSLGFIAMLIVPGLDHRFAWSNMPLIVVILGYILTVLGFAIIFRVYRENTFTSATIEVTKDQKVVSTGPYAIVRHPMYAGGLVYMLGMPLALASYWGILALVFTLPFLLWRLFDEEKFLAKNLSGYREYCAKARWRLIPGVF